MKTKAAAKSSPKAAKAKPAPSKLASLKGALKEVMPKALFNATAKGATKNAKPAKTQPAKAQAPVKAAPAPTAKGKASPAPAKAAPAPAKGKAAAAAPAPAPVAKGKAAAAPKAAAKAPRAPRISAEEMCREVACEALCTSGGYCRLHYIKNWKKIKRKELILKEGKLNQYIEELVAKYPDKYIEAIRQDLADDKAFAKVIYDLDLDESVDEFDVDGENLESIVDNIKGGRDFDDEGESF